MASLVVLSTVVGCGGGFESSQSNGGRPSRDEPVTGSPGLATGESGEVSARYQPLDIVEHALEPPEWRVHEWPIAASYLTNATMPSLAFAPNGARLYTCSDKGIAVFDTATWNVVDSWAWVGEPRPGLSTPWGFEVSGDGRRLATHRGGDLIVVRDTGDGTIVSRFVHSAEEDSLEPNDVTVLELSPDGRTAISSDTNHTAYFAWSTEDGEVLWTRETQWRHADPADFSPDGERVLLWGENSIVEVDVRSGDVLNETDVALASVEFLQYLPDGQRAVLGKVVETFDEEGSHRHGYYGVLDLEEGEFVWSAKTDFDFITGADCTADGDWIAVAGEPAGIASSVVEFRNTDDGAPEFRLDVDGDNPLVFSPDGRFLAYGDDVYEIPN